MLHRAVEGSEGGPKEDLMARWKGEDGGGAMEQQKAIERCLLVSPVNPRYLV